MRPRSYVLRGWSMLLVAALLPTLLAGCGGRRQATVSGPPLTAQPAMETSDQHATSRQGGSAERVPAIAPALAASPHVRPTHSHHMPGASHAHDSSRQAPLNSPHRPVSHLVTDPPPPESPAPLPPVTWAEEIPGPPMPSDGLTLDQAVQLNLLNDPQIRAGLENVRQAEADRITASLKPNPELDILQSLLPLGQPFVADEREGGPPQLDIFVTYPIDWFLFGKRAAAVLAASRGVEVSQAEYANLIRERVLETAVAFVEVLEAQALLDLARQNVENLQQVERITRIAVENDARPLVELHRVRLDLLGSQQEFREAQRDQAAAAAALRATLGFVQPDRDFRVAGTLFGPLTARALPVEDAFALASQNRPDIAARQLQIAQARAELTSERQEAFPEVAPQLGYTRQFQRQAIGFPDVSSYGFGVVMTLPIHDRNQGNRARAASALVQSDYELRSGLIELQAELTALAAELEAARVNAIAIGEEQLVLAGQVRDSISQAYELGARSMLEVLDAQRSYLETYRLYINTRADYWRAVHQFNAALGVQAIK